MFQFQFQYIYSVNAPDAKLPALLQGTGRRLYRTLPHFEFAYLTFVVGYLILGFVIINVNCQQSTKSAALARLPTG